MNAHLPQNKRILIIGAGKIGTDLAKLLTAENEVAIASRFTREDAKLPLRDAGVGVIQMDLTPQTVPELPRNFDIVFFQHAFHSRAEREPDRAFELNTIMTGALMEHFSQAEAVVSASTGNLYDCFPKEIVTDEDYEAPHGPYGLSRYGGEVLMRYFSQRNGTPCTILRYTYGNAAHYGVLRRLIEIIERGDPIPLSLGDHLSIISHHDLVRYTALAASVCTVPPLILNTTAPEPIPLRDIVSQICEEGDFDAPTFEQGNRAGLGLLFRCARLVDLLGPPTITWQQMIDEALGGHRQRVPTIGQS